MRNMKKKIVAMVVFVIMIMCNSMVVWAVDVNIGTNEGERTTTGSLTNNPASGYVYGTYNNTVEKVYRVDITWTDFTRVSYRASSGTWDPENLTYSGHNGVWSGEPKVKVENRSNASVDAKIEHKVNSENVGSGVKAMIDDQEASEKTINIQSAENCITPPSKEFKLGYDGIPTKDFNYLKIAEAVVTII